MALFQRGVFKLRLYPKVHGVVAFARGPIVHNDITAVWSLDC